MLTRAIIRSSERALIVLACLLPCTAASADDAGSERRFPTRAQALRPVGVASGTTSWVAERLRFPASGRDPSVPAGRETDLFLRHLVTHTGSLRVPVDSLLLHARYALTLQWLRLGDALVALSSGNLEIGASFHDVPAPGWRFELGGGVAFPTDQSTLLDGLEPPPAGAMTLFPSLPIANLLLLRGLGWDAHLVRPETLALLARARVEWDPVPELVLALDADLALHVPLNGRAAVFPQVALSAAGRIASFHLIGLRAELTSYVSFGWGEDFNVLLEPFARFVFQRGPAGLFFRVALRVPLGPAFPWFGERPVGYIGGSLTLGVAY